LVAVVVLASAEDLLLNDVVTIPVLAAAAMLTCVRLAGSGTRCRPQGVLYVSAKTPRYRPTGGRFGRGLAYPRARLAADLSQHHDVISGRSTRAGGTRVKGLIVDVRV
jgi:hypothetical protein